MEAAEHLTRLLELSRHNVFPVTSCNPLIIKFESESVLKVISLEEFGENVEEPLALNDCPEETSAPPLKVESPVKVLVPSTDKLLLTVVVPPVAPRDRVVAAPPMFSVVTVVLRRLKVVWFEVKFPPFTARFAPAVTLPVRVDTPSTVKLPLACIVPALEIDTPVVPYPPPIDAESTVNAASPALSTVAYGKEMAALLIVAVPVVAPRDRVAASPPIERFVAVVLKSVAEELVVVMSPPFTAISPAVVMFPEVPVTEKFVRLMFPVVPVISFAPRDKALTISGSERSIALVIPPPEDCILIPEDSASVVSRLSRRRSWVGRIVLSPSDSDNDVYPVDPGVVFNVKFASVSVKAMFLPVDVVIVFPPL